LCRQIFLQIADIFFLCLPSHKAVNALQEALKYTDSQQQDMLHLRRLFYGKLGQLSRERASILKQVELAGVTCQPSQPMPFNRGFIHTVDKLTETKEFADQLCANRAEESRTYMYCGICLYRCVSLFLLPELAEDHALVSGLSFQL